MTTRAVSVIIIVVVVASIIVASVLVVVVVGFCAIVSASLPRLYSCCWPCVVASALSSCICICRHVH